MTDHPEHKPPVEDGLVERLRKYRPTNEWGDSIHHVICDEAADALASRDATIAALKRELGEAILQLEYLDERLPTGTTPAVLSKLRAFLTRQETPRVYDHKPAPFGQLGDMPDGGEG